MKKVFHISYLGQGISAANYATQHPNIVEYGVAFNYNLYFKL